MANKAVDAGTYGVGAAIGGGLFGPLGAVLGVVAAHGVKTAAGQAKDRITSNKEQEGNPHINVNVA